MEQLEEPKSYTIINMYHAHMVQGVEDRNGNTVQLDYLCGNNNPRVSIDGLKGIATGIFRDECVIAHKTQAEAESLMNTPEWTVLENNP